jgi:glucose-6-phosphate isomerase
LADGLADAEETNQGSKSQNKAGEAAVRADAARPNKNGIRRDGFTDIVPLGMGGSSLAPEVRGRLLE